MGIVHWSGTALHSAHIEIAVISPNGFAVPRTPFNERMKVSKTFDFFAFSSVSIVSLDF